MHLFRSNLQLLRSNWQLFIARGHNVRVLQRPIQKWAVGLGVVLVLLVLIGWARSSSDNSRHPALSVASKQTLELLATLPTKGRAPKTGYSRAQFGQAWTDNVAVADGHNGCDTRNDVLTRDLTAVAFRRGSSCVVATGTLHDVYTGRTIQFVRGAGTSTAVQIDHMVALSDAWQTGAQLLTRAQRTNLANDPLNLQAVDGPTNEAKGDSDAATWLPPNKAYRCTYVTRQVQVKAKYHLWVTPAERDAIARVLASC